MIKLDHALHHSLLSLLLSRPRHRVCLSCGWTSADPIGGVR